MNGAGWTADLVNALAAVKNGETGNVQVYVSQATGAAASAMVTLTAVSESDPTKRATATVRVGR